MLLKQILRTCCIMLLGAIPLSASAQQHTRFRPANDAYFTARDAASSQLYALASIAARESLSRSFAGTKNCWTSEEEQSHYIIAISGLKLNTVGALDSAVALQRQTISAPIKDRLSLAIARYHFLHGSLSDAIPYYESAGIANLSNVEIGDAKFELAYCYFNNHQFPQADTLFRIMKEVPGRYYSPGNYYYGLLAYNRGDYKEALRSFDRINNEPIYRPIVPYYMAEIYYFMGDRDKALSEALRLIKRTDKLYYDNELHLLAAQTLFEEGRYGDALPYFEHYYERTDKIRKEELYEMGYAYYRVGEWKNAIDKFKPLSAAQDSLGQTAMYLLGDCYLKTGDKMSARSAFGICASMPYNPGQREAALMLHSKLSYELGHSDDAMRSVRVLLADYPSGKYVDDARLLQSQLFLETSNYKDAYEALANSSFRTDDVYGRTLQRAAYGYALQQFQNRNYSEASLLLSQALNNPIAQDYTAASQFWKAEALYNLHQFDSAVYFAQRFLAAPAAPLASKLSAAATPAQASLTLGYASMELKDFSSAQLAFKQAQTGTGAGSSNAMLREADAWFMQKNFTKAAPLYAALASGKGADADYARLQSAVIAGLRGDDAEKASLLQAILAAPSPYSAEARYELGVTQIATAHYDDAVATLQPLISDKRTAAFAAKALVKTGTAYQQLNQDDKALEVYRRLVQDWPSAPERTEALAAMKSIYIERNQPDAYTSLLRQFNLPQASDEELDAAYYNAAEVQYASSNWAAAQIGFRRYLELYPLGARAEKARFYLANSLYNAKSYKAAWRAYDTVLQMSWSSVSEESAVRAAELAVADTAWSDALRYFSLLSQHTASNTQRIQAFAGMMNAASKLGDDALTRSYADSLLQLSDIPGALRDEALLHRLRHNIQTNKNEGVDSTLRLLSQSESGIVAAEAKYLSAQRLMNAGKLKEAEAMASATIKRSAGYEYWVIKSYLLLGDILVRQKDYFNARATYQSIIQNSRIPALKEEASRKLADMKSLEGSKLSNE